MNANIRQYMRTLGLSVSAALFCALLCLVVPGCSEESFSMASEDSPAISMTATSTEITDAPAGKVASRAIVDSDEKLRETTLGVYAHMLMADKSRIKVFDNESIYYNAGWKYDKTQYWIKSATEYRFVAYSPHLTGNVSYNMGTHTLDISNIPYWQEVGDAVEDVDYLVANSSDNPNSYLSPNSKGVVHLQFGHILSQLLVMIKKDEKLDDTEYMLKSVDYMNVPKGDGVATYTWASDNGSMGSIETVSELNRFDKDVGVKIKSDENIMLSHLTVPFALTDEEVKIKLTYTVAGTERSKIVEDTKITGLDAGKRYELTLTISGTGIVPKLAVKPWEDIDVDEDPKYNW